MNSKLLESGNFFIEWASTKIKILSLIIVGCIGAAFILFQVLHHKSSFSGNEFIRAHKIFEKCVSKANVDNIENFQKLDEVLGTLPTLHSKYDGVIAQKFLSENDTTNATKYAQPLWKRTKGRLPYYSQFGQTSLLVTQGEYHKALEESLALKQKMDSDSSFWALQGEKMRYGGLLYSQNLLRIALLYKEIGSSRNEFLAWNELEKYGGWGEEASSSVCLEGYQILNQILTEKSISLVDFIKARKDALVSGS